MHQKPILGCIPLAKCRFSQCRADSPTTDTTEVKGKNVAARVAERHGRYIRGVGILVNGTDHAESI